MTRLTPRLGDAAIAVGVFSLALAGSWQLGEIMPNEARELDALGIALIAVSTLVVAWRQRLPRTTLWVASIGWSVYVALSYVDANVLFGVIIAMYSVALYLPRRRALTHGISAAVMCSLWTTLGVILHITQLASVAELLIVLAIPFALGLADARRHSRITELELAHQRQEQAQRLAAADAVRAERARIARELHDVVAHEITVMTLQAEGARRRAQHVDPALAEALATIADSGRKGLAEMQRMIGVLRTSEREAAEEAAVLSGHQRSGFVVGAAGADDMGPMPSLASIPALVRQVEEAGLPVYLSITGTSHVPAGVELSAYRIIQESLTNALKYAGRGATATVSVRRRKEAVTITIEDDGRGAIRDVATASGGHGIPGMRERVAALGGTIEVGPRKGGGYRVLAVLPVTDDQITSASKRRGAEVTFRMEVQR